MEKEGKKKKMEDARRRIKSIKRVFIVFSFKSSIPYLVLLLGIVSVVFGFLDIIKSETIKEILKWIGNASIVGCIIGFMTSYAQIRGVLRQEIADIMTSHEHLYQRNDIHNYWGDVSKVLFSSKFPEVCDKLLFAVRDKYFPIDHQYYLDDYSTIMTINWKDKKKKIVNIVHEDRYRIITNTTDKIPIKSKLSGLITNKEDCLFKTNLIEINGSAIDFNEEPTYNSDNTFLCIDTDYCLSGCVEYNFKRELTKQQNIDIDPYVGFRAKTFVNNLRLQVFNEIKDDIEVMFIGRGLLNDEKIIKKRDDYLEIGYNGLILHKQGFVLIIKEKEHLNKTT